VLVFILLLTTTTMADTFLISHKVPGFEARVNGGYMSGVSNEEVYDADGSVSGIKGHKISQLDWHFDRESYLVSGFR